MYLGSDLDGGGDEIELPSLFSVAIVAIKGEDYGTGMKDDVRDFDGLGSFCLPKDRILHGGDDITKPGLFSRV